MKLAEINRLKGMPRHRLRIAALAAGASVAAIESACRYANDDPIRLLIIEKTIEKEEE